MRKLAPALAAAVVMSSAALALAAGETDTDYGNDGYAFQEYPAAVGDGLLGPNGMKIAVDSENRVLVATAVLDRSGSSDVSRLELRRVLPDGSADTSFGTGGVVQQAYDDGTLAVQSPQVDAMQLDASDGVYVAISDPSPDEGAEFAIAHFDATGAKDTAFVGFGGPTAVYSTDGAPACTASQPLVRAMRPGTGGSLDVLFEDDCLPRASTRAGGLGTTNARIGRYTALGRPDNSFGSFSLEPARPPVAGTHYLLAGAVQPGSPAAGLLGLYGTVDGPDATLELTRFDADGDVDAAFMPAGRLGVTADPGEYPAIATGPGGVIGIVRAPLESSSPKLLRVLRRQADGDPDPAFDGDGAAALTLSGSSYGAAGAAFGTDGALFAAVGRGTAVEVRRFAPDGALDASFGQAGVATVPGSGDSGAGLVFSDTATDRDGRLLIGAIRAATVRNRPRATIPSSPGTLVSVLRTAPDPTPTPTPAPTATPAPTPTPATTPTPTTTTVPPPVTVTAARRCSSRRTFTVRVRGTRRKVAAVRTVSIVVNGKRVRVRRSAAGRFVGTVDLRRLRRGTYRVVATVTFRGYPTVRDRRTYRTCRTPQESRPFKKALPGWGKVVSRR